MKALTKDLLVRGMAVLHYAAMLLMFVGTWNTFYAAQLSTGGTDTRSLAVCVCYAVALLTLNRLYRVYKVGIVRVGEIVYSQVLADLVSLAMTYILACVLAMKLLNPLAGFGVAAVQGLFCAVWTLMANKLYFKIHKPKKTIIIYRNERDLQKLEEVRFFEKRWEIARTVQWNEADAHDLPCDESNMNGASNADIHQLIDIMKDYEAVFVSGVNATLRNGIVKYCVEANKPCFFVPHTGDVITAGATHIRSFAVPICRVRRCSPSPAFLFVKRAFDVAVSLTGIIVLSPFMLATAIAIKSYDHGPVLYRQVRLTKDGRQFKILKFRSMRTDAEKDGVARLASDHDDRITPIGKFIRAVRFDELPQLFNILLGDMSIVGPRPERPEIAEQYMKELPAFDLRLQVKAGLTGYAQVYGRYNTEPQDKLKMDLMYINNIGVMEDLKLMFATVRILFMKESTSGIADGQTTASKAETEKSA